MVCGSGESTSRLAKAAGAEPSGQIRGEKLHAAVSRSAFPSQHAQKTTFADHFWTFRCRFVWQARGIVHLVKGGKHLELIAVSSTTTTLDQNTLHYTPLHYNYLYNYKLLRN